MNPTPLILAYCDSTNEVPEPDGSVDLAFEVTPAVRWAVACALANNPDVFYTPTTSLAKAIETALLNTAETLLGGWLTKQVEATEGPCPELGTWVSAHTNWMFTHTWSVG